MGLNDVKVVVFEGDAGLTPGGAHETMNSAWALGLDNLFFLIDWNNFGIDDHPLTETVPNTPNEWFGSHNWRVFGTMKGNDFPDVFEVVNSLFTDIQKNIPT